MKSPYEILGIPQDASDEMIKKAYKDLARKYHPDKGGSEESFKEINDAYTQIMNGENPMDTFQDLFNMFSGIGLRQFMRGPAIQKTITITLAELQSGVTRAIEYKRMVPTGKYKNTVTQTPFGTMNIVEPESIEKEYTANIVVPKCHDTRFPLIIQVPADNVPPSELEVMVKVMDDPDYTRVPGTLDLETTLQITLKESLIGFTKEIKLLGSQKSTKIECGTIIGPYDTKRIKSYGLYDGNDYGDLIIKFNVIYPLILSKKTIEILTELDLETNIELNE